MTPPTAAWTSGIGSAMATETEAGSVETSEREDGEQRRYVCDQEGCGQEFASALRLGLHKRQAHGIIGRSARAERERKQRAEGGKTPSSPRRRQGETRQARRARLLRETIAELTDFTDELRGRSEQEPEDLADVLHRDAGRISSAVAYAAERFSPLGSAVDFLAGHGGPLTFIRGFLGVGKWAVRRWRRLLAEREQALADAELLGEDGTPPPGTVILPADEPAPGAGVPPTYPER